MTSGKADRINPLALRDHRRFAPAPFAKGELVFIECGANQRHEKFPSNSFSSSSSFSEKAEYYDKTENEESFQQQQYSPERYQSLQQSGADAHQQRLPARLSNDAEVRAHAQADQADGKAPKHDAP